MKTPEEKANSKIKYVLNKIKEKLLISGPTIEVSGQKAVEYSLYPKHFSGEYPIPDEELLILSKLQDEGAITKGPDLKNQGRFLVIISPKFDEIFDFHRAKGLNIEEKMVLQLRKLFDNGKIIGVAIYTEKELKTPLSKLGVTDTDFLNIQRLFMAEGYLEGYSHKDDLETIKLTDKGFRLIMDKEQHKVKSEPIKSFNFFTIPPKATEKIKVLIEEINQLQAKAIEEQPNLISHQLRTVLGLALLDYWERLNDRTLTQSEKGGLKDIIKHTINKAKTEKLNNAKHIVEFLEEIRAKKTKVYADNLVHCNYSLVGSDLVDDFCRQIANLLSQIYGR